MDEARPAGTESYALGYRDVDADPDAVVLLAAMEATAGWDATRRLRAWERESLALRPGERLLDVGCGLGEAALALAEDLGPTGELVGIDASEAMLRGARAAAASARCTVRFTVGDAQALREASGAFDAARSERTLQWLPDPAAAVAELSRVVRPGGRLSLIDTDWSTFAIDIGDASVAASVQAAMQTEGARPSHVGRRLAELLVATGNTPVARAAATQTWTDWDPDADPAPVGCFSMESLADDLVARALLEARDRDGFVASIHQAARDGRFRMQLTMFGVIAVKPS